MLPPVRYPDGKTYLKIGGDPDDLSLGSLTELQSWFRSGGRDVARAHHARIMKTLVPVIDVSRISIGACVVSKTATAYPFIDFSDDPAIAVLTGGCGAAAKSSDENRPSWCATDAQWITRRRGISRFICCKFLVIACSSRLRNRLSRRCQFGRAAALYQCRKAVGGGKSGLHGNTVPDNVRRGRP